VRQRDHPGRNRNRDGRRQRRQAEGGHKLESPLLVGNRREDADREREPGTTAIGEVEGRQQDREGASGKRPRAERGPARRETEGEQHSDRGQDPERVPVADRRFQAVARDGIEEAEPVRKQARGKSVRREDRDPGQEAPQKV
jgi:hypothetical protein